jgi:hypothetical protein
MPRKFTGNGNAPTSHNDVPAAAPKKEWDCYLTTEAAEGAERGDLLGAFTIKGGVSKGGKPYLCLSGYSKSLNKGLSIFFSDKDGGGKNIDKLIDKMVEAGYLK